MDLYSIGKSIVINNKEKCLNILSDDNITLWINGDTKQERLMGASFKIKETDGVVYKIFDELFKELVDEYNAFKDFNDYEYSQYKLYDTKYNWFTFYDDYSNINKKNFLRIVKNEKVTPNVIGIYIKQRENRRNSHVLAKSGSRYPQFIPCFNRLITSLKKQEKSKEKSYMKIKEDNNG